MYQRKDDNDYVEDGDQGNDGQTSQVPGRLFYKRRPKQIPKLKPRNWRSQWLEGCPYKKGICVRVFVKTPKKPNSGLRKVARVRLSTGKTTLVYIPGIGHNLNVHSVVLVRGGRLRDIPGCNYKAVRGANDLLPVKNRGSARSKYGVKLPADKKAWRVDRLNWKNISITEDREYFNKYKWMTYKNPDGSMREEPLREDEEVPPPRGLHYAYLARKAKAEKK